jgi:RNA polymerase sigma factor (sigma-70 family)
MSSINGPDALLGPYLRAQEPAALEASLGELIGSHADPVVRRVVASRLSGLANDIEDVSSVALIELLLHLKRIKAGRPLDAIADFRAYAATVAANACNRYFKRRQQQLAASIPADSVPEAGTNEEPESALDTRRFVSRLWEEIGALPREQRVALLLNLRDRRGNSVLFLFPLCGVADFRRIAAVLEMPEHELLTLWNELPADDNSIAKLLGCARQRVINLRKASRKRLTNRLGAR